MVIRICIYFNKPNSYIAIKKTKYPMKRYDASHAGIQEGDGTWRKGTNFTSKFDGHCNGNP